MSVTSGAYIISSVIRGCFQGDFSLFVLRCTVLYFVIFFVGFPLQGGGVRLYIPLCFTVAEVVLLKLYPPLFG